MQFGYPHVRVHRSLFVFFISGFEHDFDHPLRLMTLNWLFVQVFKIKILMTNLRSVHQKQKSSNGFKKRILLSVYRLRLSVIPLLWGGGVPPRDITGRVVITSVLTWHIIYMVIFINQQFTKHFWVETKDISLLDIDYHIYFSKLFGICVFSMLFNFVQNLFL